MELIVKHFSELSAEELFEIYKLRVSVFIVEQSCPYQDIDDADKSAYHVWLRTASKPMPVCSRPASPFRLRPLAASLR